MRATRDSIRLRTLGFTLYEILIAMGLLAILAMLALFGWRVQLARARDAQRKASLSQFKLALISYRDDAGCFPPAEEMYCFSDFLDPYLPEVPCDPSNNDIYKFEYVSNACDEFVVYTNLEWEDDEDIAEIGCTGGCGPASAYNFYVTNSDIASTGTNEEGTRPTCGINADQCIPNVCSECCSGSQWRCNSDGDMCIYDTSCPIPTP